MEGSDRPAPPSPQEATAAHPIPASDFHSPFRASHTLVTVLSFIPKFVSFEM